MTTALSIFTKAPIPGHSKTRLIPALGAEGAAQLQQKMTEQKVVEAVQSQLGAVTLYCTPDCDHPSFQQLQSAYGVHLVQQQGNDLGERMSRAIGEALRQHRKVILVGCDSPQLGREVLREVERALEQVDVVFVPALDGGYVLVAMRQPVTAVFRGIHWGSNRVMAETRAILQREGIHWDQLPPIRDVDEPEDLEVIPKAWLQEIGVDDGKE